MPIFTQPISQQNISSNSGTKFYPSIPSLVPGVFYGDHFNRETLNVTNAYVLYTSAIVGSGTNTIYAVSQTNAHYLTALDMITSNVSNDSNSIRSSGLSMNTDSCIYNNLVNSTTLQSQFSITPNFTTSGQFFVGLLAKNSSLTSLPTTEPHIGIFVDTSGTGNYIFSCADGITQKTTDTGVALSGTSFVYNLTWTGNGQSVVYNLYNGYYTGNVPTPSKTVTHTVNIPNGPDMEIHYFLKTLTTATKEILSRYWISQVF